jgi:hypothetical protein
VSKYHKQKNLVFKHRSENCSEEQANALAFFFTFNFQNCLVMNLLSGYGSGSDDDAGEEQTFEIKVPVKIVPVVASKPVIRNDNNGGKKVKKLDISFLPPEIAAALARGNTYDSDDDDMYSKPSTQKVSKPANTSNDFSSQLLSLLPAPKENNPKDLTPSYFPTSVPVQKEPTQATESKPKFNFAYTQQTTTTTSLKASTDTSAPIIETASKPRVSTYVSPFYKPTNLATNTPIDSFSSKDVGPITPGPTYPTTQNTNNNYQNLQHNYASSNSTPAQYQDIAIEEDEDEFSAHHNKLKRKKRDRELEHQLMAGDLSGIESSAISDVKADLMWNSEKYNEQQQREAQIQAQFGGAGKAGGIAQPNKVTLMISIYLFFVYEFCFWHFVFFCVKLGFKCLTFPSQN